MFELILVLLVIFGVYFVFEPRLDFNTEEYTCILWYTWKGERKRFLIE